MTDSENDEMAGSIVAYFKFGAVKVCSYCEEEVCAGWLACSPGASGPFLLPSMDAPAIACLECRSRLVDQFHGAVVPGIISH